MSARLGKTPKRVVIVGGGFAGLHLVRALEHRLRPGEAEVTLLDRNNYHLFTPLLYQVATGELPSHAVAYPLRSATAPAGVRFVQTEVSQLDLEAKRVVTADGLFHYDQLIVAPGTVTNDYGIPGVVQHALPTKTLAEAQAVKRRLLESFERAAIEADPARRRALLTFIIIGAGPVGVELAASMRDLMKRTLQPMYPHLDLSKEVAVILIDGSQRLLAQMDPRLGVLAQRQLERQHVRIVLGTTVTEVSRGRVVTKDGARFAGDTIIWAGGVRANPLVAALEVPKGRDQRLLVDNSFRVDGRSDVLAFGDAAWFEQNGSPLPQLAQVAVLEAPAVAANLVLILRDRLPVAYVHHAKGDLIALGRTHAGAQIKRFLGVPMGNAVIGGIPAWTLWRANYLMQLLGVRNRATLLLEWTLSYFFSRMVANTP